MKTIVSSIVTAAVLTLSVSSMSFSNSVNAHEGFSEKSHMANKDHRQFKRMAKYLALTDEQKQQVKAFKVQEKEDRNSIKEKMKSYKAQVKLLLEGAEFDEQAFTQLHSAYQDTFTKVAMLRAKHKHQMLQILTPDQREKAQEMKGKRKHH